MNALCCNRSLVLLRQAPNAVETAGPDWDIRPGPDPHRSKAEANPHLAPPRAERAIQMPLQQHADLFADRAPEARLDIPRTAIRLMVVDTVPDDLPENTVIVADDPSAIPNARSFADLDG